MKKFTFLQIVALVAFLGFAGPACAQEQVKNTEISPDYSRCSISNITTLYGDEWDSSVLSGISSMESGLKFDKNKIRTTNFNVDGAFRKTTDQMAAESKNESLGDTFKSLFTSFKDTLTVKIITDYLNNNNVGKEILDFYFNVDASGRFNADVIKERSNLNATDKDVTMDNALQVKTMDSKGLGLIANSYIVVYDVKDPSITTSEDGKRTYGVSVIAYVYSIDNASDIINNVNYNMWIQDSDDAATVAAKKEAYSNLRVPLKLIAQQQVTSTSSNSTAEAVAKSYSGCLDKLERKIPAWQVTADLEDSDKYLRAKIGKKEDLKNGDRYRIYGYKGDADEGTLRVVKKGFARATEITDNSGVTSGNTEPSYFYQISGPKLKGGEFLKQSNDIKLGFSLNYNYNGLGMGPQEMGKRIFGSFSQANIAFDYMVHIHKCGIKHYVRLNLGYDINTGSDLEKGREQMKATLITLDDKYVYANGVSFINGSVGYGIGLPASRFVEFQPYIMFGVDGLLSHTSLDENQLTQMSEFVYGEGKGVTFTDKTKNTLESFYFNPGLRITFNCGYPFQIYLQGDYCLQLYEDAAYKMQNTYLKQCGYGHEKGLGVALGFKWTF